MRIPLRFRAETKYAEASEKKANVNPPMMAAVGNGDTTTFRVAGRDNFYWIRLINDANRLTQCFSPAVALQYDDYIYVAKASDRKLTYYEFVSFIQAVGGETSPILTARGIIIPDNEAQAFYIEDDDSVGAGTPEYVRIVSTDGAQAVEFNFNNDDVNFIVNANALADAINMDGATGAITLAGPSMQVPDNWWLGLGAGAGRLVFDSTPAPDQVVMTSADLNMNGNDIIIPDNTAVAFQILDDGAAAPANIDYMQIVTTNAGPAQAVVFNNGEVDVDFRVCASGGISDPTDAFFIEGSTGNVYIGDDAPPNAAHLAVTDLAVNTASTFIGIASVHTKTAGATDHNDTMIGFQSILELNQAAGEVGAFYGASFIARQTLGDVGDAVNVRNLYGFWGQADLNAGTVHLNAIGVGANVDQEAAHTVSGDVYGLHVQVDAAGTTTGNVYMLYLNEVAGVNYGIYQNGTARHYLQGTTAIGGTDSTAAQLYVDQSAAAGAVPVLLLDQADLSEEFIEFTTTVGAGNPIDTAAIGTYYGKARVSVTGVGFKYVALYNS